MRPAYKRCAYCGRWFQPDPRIGRRQKACPRPECGRARRRQNWRSWSKRRPDFPATRRHKVRAWAKACPDYWAGWRKDHPAYREREKRRMLAKRRRARRVAKQTAMPEIAVGKLRDIQAMGPEAVAKQTASSRQMEEVVEFLLWKEGVANQTDMGTQDGTRR